MRGRWELGMKVKFAARRRTVSSYSRAPLHTSTVKPAKCEGQGRIVAK